MTSEGEETATPFSADEAFAVLGSEVRLEVLQALGEADGPLAYSELFDRIDYEDSANFSYHQTGWSGTSSARPRRNTPHVSRADASSRPSTPAS